MPIKELEVMKIVKNDKEKQHMSGITLTGKLFIKWNIENEKVPTTA